MTDISKTNIIENVVSDLLTKGELNLSERHVLQYSLTGQSDGDLGRGSAAAIMGHLDSPQNLHLATRLSPYIQDTLKDNGQAEPLAELTDKALAQGYDPQSLQNDTIESMLNQPYPLSEVEMRHLQKELKSEGHYSKDTWTSGEKNPETLEAIEKYITKNPDTPLNNPEIIDAMQARGEYDSTLENITKNNPHYKEEIQELAKLNESAPDDKNNPVTYHLQDRLKSGGYDTGALDGAKGQSLDNAIKDFENDLGKQASALRQGWNNKGQDFTENSRDIGVNNTLTLDAPNGIV